MENNPKFRLSETQKRSGTTTIGEAIRDMLVKYRLQTRFEETYVGAHWEKIMGPVIASRTTRAYVSAGTLYVEIESAPLRNELVLAKQKIIESINRELKAETVKDMVFL